MTRDFVTYQTTEKDAQSRTPALVNYEKIVTNMLPMWKLIVQEGFGIDNNMRVRTISWVMFD